MQFNNKTTRSVAEAVAKIMAEKLHPNQQKLDVHEPEKDKLTADDFKKLRAMKKEETEHLKEYESDKSGRYVHKGTYGSTKGSDYGSTDWDKEESGKDDEKKKPARRKYGARQNFVRSSRVNEDFTNLFTAFKEGGLKSLEEGMAALKAKKEVKEEVAVEQPVHNQVQVIDMTDPNEIKQEVIDIEEQTTQAKKPMSFKERYGSRSKE